MKKVIGVTLLIICALGIFINSIIYQKGLNESNKSVTNDSYTSQNLQEPDDSQMTDAQRAVRGRREDAFRPDPNKKRVEEIVSEETKELTPQEIADQEMADFYAPNMSNANKIPSVNEPGTLTPEYTEKSRFDMFIPFILLGILGIYFVTRKRN